MGNSKELFTSIREAELHQSEEYQNYLKLAYLRGFNTSTGTKIYPKGLNKLKTSKNGKSGNTEI
jgi:hypothetical protein